MQLTLTVDTAHGYDECGRQVAEFAKRLNGATAAGPAKPAPSPTAQPLKAGASTDPAAASAKGKGGRPTKEQIAAREAAKKAEEAAALAGDDGLGSFNDELPPEDDGLGDLGDGGGPAEPAVSYDQLLEAFKAYAKKNGRPAATKIMQRFGAAGIQDIPQENWGQALRAVEG